MTERLNWAELKICYKLMAIIRCSIQYLLVAYVFDIWSFVSLIRPLPYFASLLFPLVNTSLFSVSVSLFLFSHRHLFYFLHSMCNWYCIVFFWLISLTMISSSLSIQLLMGTSVASVSQPLWLEVLWTQGCMCLCDLMFSFFPGCVPGSGVVRSYGSLIDSVVF